MKQNYAALTTAQLVETLYVSQTERRLEAKRLALMEEVEKTIAEELIRRKPEDIPGFVIQRTTTSEPFAEDWAKTLQYIKDTGSVDLLEKRLLKSGVKARWADGLSIPGVSKVEKTTLKVEKL